MSCNSHSLRDNLTPVSPLPSVIASTVRCIRYRSTRDGGYCRHEKISELRHSTHCLGILQSACLASHSMACLGILYVEYLIPHIARYMPTMIYEWSRAATFIPTYPQGMGSNYPCGFCRAEKARIWSKWVLCSRAGYYLIKKNSISFPNAS